MRDRRHNAEWTEGRIAKLTELWGSGSSASQIATALNCGFTRNAVIGKVTRLKLTRDPNAKPKPRAPKPKAQPKPNPMGSLEGHRHNVIKGVQGAQKSGKAVPLESPLKARLKAAQDANASARRVPIMDLEPRQCRYAVNDAGQGEEHLFCGAPAKPGSSYCAAHHGVVYSPAPPRKRKSESDLDSLDATRRRSVAGGRK